MEAECLRCCTFAGVVFQGIQKGEGTLPSLVLFAADWKSTTLCLPVDKLTPLAIKERMLDAEKTRRVFQLKFKPAGATTTSAAQSA